MALSVNSQTYKQDLPPKGGYAPVDFTTIPARKVIKRVPLIDGYFVYKIFAHL